MDEGPGGCVAWLSLNLISMNMAAFKASSTMLGSWSIVIAILSMLSSVLISFLIYKIVCKKCDTKKEIEYKKCDSEKEIEYKKCDSEKEIAKIKAETDAKAAEKNTDKLKETTFKEVNKSEDRSKKAKKSFWNKKHIRNIVWKSERE